MFPEYNRKLYAKLRTVFPLDSIEDSYLYVDGDEAILYEGMSVFVDHVHFGDRGNRTIGMHMFTVLNKCLGHTENSQRFSVHVQK